MNWRAALRFRPRFLAKTDQILWLLHSRCTRFSPALMPWAGSSSAMNRYPKAGSSRWIQGRVDQVRIRPVPVRDRVGLPFVERLFGEAKHPAGHLHGDSVGGKVKDQREAL